MNKFSGLGEPIGDAISEVDRRQETSRVSDLDAVHRAAADAIEAVRCDARAEIDAVKFDLELERAGRRGDALVRGRLAWISTPPKPTNFHALAA